MIALDSSALMAIVGSEPAAPACRAALRQASGFCLSAATVSEVLIVADRRGAGAQMRTLLRSLDPEIVSVTTDTAYQVAGTYTRWGKGVHPASLNWGDCFSYVLAKQRGCPLLFIGEDFSRTDVIAA